LFATYARCLTQNSFSEQQNASPSNNKPDKLSWDWLKAIDYVTRRFNASFGGAEEAHGR
jgi:hypothetical protein